MTIGDAELEPPPLAVAQEALWYQTRLAPNRILYNEAVSVRKDGPLDLQALRSALNEVVRRHEAWRTTFGASHGRPIQVVGAPPNLELPVIDLSRLAGHQAEGRAVRLVSEVASVPYDLARGPLLRPRLIRFPGEHHRLYLAMHHLIFDGVSINRLVFPELVALYDAFAAGLPSPLPEPETGYTDYARWEQRWITGPRALRRFEHWRGRLAAPPALSLPLDQLRPKEPRFRGGMIPLALPQSTSTHLRELGHGVGATLFQVLAATWAVLLGRITGQQDVVFATPVDLRRRPELESVVGCCLTPVVLRVDLSGDPTFAELVVRVRNELLDGLDHLLPFERIVRELYPGGASNVNPIFQTMVVLEPASVTVEGSWSVHQLESEIGNAIGNTKLDLELQLDERADGSLAGRLIYDRDLFDPSTATRMAAHWSAIASAAAGTAGDAGARIPALTSAEDDDQLAIWNATTSERSPGTLDDLVRERCARHADAIALSANGHTVSYGELDRGAERVAGRLLASGVGSGDVVGLCSELSIDLVLAVLGVIRAGAAYLLLDPDLPREVLDSMLADSGAGTVLAQSPMLTHASVPAERVLPLAGNEAAQPGGSVTREPADVDPVCCVHYTSSANAQRVGVQIRGSSVTNAATALAADLCLGPADSALVLGPRFFQAATLELWMPLLAGARIVLVTGDQAGDGAHLNRLIRTERVSFIHARPSTWRQLIDTGLKPARGIKALSSGEPLPAALAEHVLERCRLLWNGYGAPETTAVSTLARVQSSGPLAIGAPIANTRAFVVDGAARVVPVGVVGELVLAGAGVAAGYINRPDLTAEAFPQDQSGLGTVYRTGDFARWRPDGQLELVPQATPGTEPLRSVADLSQ